MEFGKLEDLSGVDFRLPDDPPFNRTTFDNLFTDKNLPRVYVGATGWAMKEWVGTVYPPGAKTRDFLYHYARQFNTIELNTTHYRVPDVPTIERWRRLTPPDFRFCPKLPQTVSHSRFLGKDTEILHEFCAAVAGLEERLGCCFIQLPPWFEPERLPVLAAFLEDFPSEIPLAVEVRHPDWFNDPARLRDFLDCLRTEGVTAVLTDVAGRRDVLHMGVTTDTAMIRFVGNGLHATDFSRIDEWVARLNNWFEKGLREVYFFTHEPDNIRAPELARYLCEQLQNRSDVLVRGPEIRDPDADAGRQMSLF